MTVSLYCITSYLLEFFQVLQIDILCWKVNRFCDRIKVSKVEVKIEFWLTFDRICKVLYVHISAVTLSHGFMFYTA